MKNEPRITDVGFTASHRMYLALEGCGDFSLRKTFDCGQTFRFEEIPCHEAPDAVSVLGNAFGRWIQFTQIGDRLILTGTTPDEYETIWKPYLGFDEDYGEADRAILAAMPDDAGREIMSRAVGYGRGIRILRQDPFETLISLTVCSP